MKKDRSHSSSDLPHVTELLEERRLLSDTVMQPMLTLEPSTTSYVSGFTPAQISKAYGFNQLSGNGAGQTIAIVDAYRHPNIASDLHVFDQQFGLSDPVLTVVNQYGGSVASVPTNAGWSTEIALDVEWAHAMAPQAKILLVEASSASLSDLLKAVDYARHVPGVSVVSMSWGGSEFSGQQNYDSYFTTPAGHTGITFIAASGDSGSGYGPSWPSTSRNVLAVGGTNLYLNSTGGYGSETGWSYSTGGVSRYVSEPSYQLKAQQTGARTSPDVAYNATGFAIYSSVPDNGYVGWSTVGGTSAGAPQWAALIAIADQLRVATGKGTLDGVTGTLPTLYSLYSPYGTAGYSTYTAAFNDIIRGSTSSYISAHTGYDEVVGLGTPKAPQVVNALAGLAKMTATTTATTTLTATNSLVKIAAIHADSDGAAPAPDVQTATPHAQGNFSSTALYDHAAFVNSTQGADAVGFTSATSSFATGDALPEAAITGSAGRMLNATGDAAPQAIGAVAAVVSADTPVVTTATEVVAHAAMPFVHANALATMAADGVASLMHDSAMLGAALSPDVTSSNGVTRRITEVTLAADGILIAVWVAHVFNQQRTVQMAGALPPDTMIRPMNHDED